MVIDNTKRNRPSLDGGGGDGSGSTMKLESLARVDMKKLSQSELYTLSCSSSSAFDLQSPENLVIPNVTSNHPPPVPITITSTTPPSKIFAFSHRRAPRRRISASLNDEADQQLRENRLILDSLKQLVAQGDTNDSSPQRDTVMVDNEGEVPTVQRRKRTRKSKTAEENEEEFEGLDVINLNGEEIDLKFLARVADGAFQAELNRMTEGMVREDEFLGFMNGLEGRWGSSRKRRKYVDAAYFVKALPGNWRILLSLRPRVRQPSLYCRRFVSPSDEHFKSCKDVALHLKTQLVRNDANPPEEGAMMQVERDCQVNLESVARVPRSAPPATEVDLLGTNSLLNVPIYSLIECRICRDSFTSIGDLESHMEKFHKTSIQRLDMDTLTRKRSVPCDVVCIQEHKHLPVTCQKDDQPPKSVVVEKQMEPLEDYGMTGNELRLNDAEETRKFKTRCMWCLVEFFCEPIEKQTLSNSSAFKCPECEAEIDRRVKIALSKLNQHAND